MAGRLELRSPAAPPHTRGQRAARVQDPTRARHRAAEACPEIATADDDYTKVLSLTGAAPATASGYKICPRADPFTLHASRVAKWRERAARTADLYMMCLHGTAARVHR